MALQTQEAAVAPARTLGRPTEDSSMLTRRHLLKLGLAGGSYALPCEVFLKFQDYPGPFTFHCHNLARANGEVSCSLDGLS